MNPMVASEGTPDIRLRFITPKSSDPANKVAEVEVLFGEGCGIFTGIVGRGYTVWQGERSMYVTLPARAFGVGSKRKYFDYIDDADGDPSAPRSSALKKWILDSYDKAEADREREEIDRRDREAAIKAGQVVHPRAKENA